MIGTTLRQYHITARLGQGGMGEVWKARDTVLERDVALKTLPGADGDAAARKERFFREARAASALNHPNIITVYEINSDQGIDFIAMEFVSGRTLAEILRQAGHLEVAEVQRLGLQMGEAVARAHRAGIVHRDLKPGNIMVTDEGLVKVLDFGLAKVSQAGPEAADAATMAALTMAGTSVGTVGYMSPEQAVGDVVDARSDVFSFGVILYEMLAGRRPFMAPNRLDLLHELHFTEPTPVGTLRPGTPAWMAAVVHRALAKKPAERYADLAELMAAFRSAAGADPGSSSALPLMPAPSGRGRRGRAWLWPVAGAVLVALGAGVWMRGLDGPTPTAPGAAGAAGDAAPSVSELTRQAAALLARQDRDGNVDRAVTLLEQALAIDQNAAVAHAYLSEAYLRKRIGNPDPQWLTMAREAARRSLALNPDLAASHVASGFAHLEAGEHEPAVSAFRKAADLDPAHPQPHNGLGQALAASKQDEAAATAFATAIRLGADDWRPRIGFGQFHFSRARYAEAAAEWEAALRLTPDNALVLRNLGAAYYLLERHDEAASILQRALEVRPDAPVYTNLGTIRFFQGRYADAVDAFEKAVELGANNPLYWGNLGDGYRWAPGRRGEAAAAYRRATDLIAQDLAKRPHDVDLLSRQALYLAKMGGRDEARRALQGLDGDASLTAQMLYRLTVVNELLGDRSGALAALERALKAGYPVADLAREPEFTALRADARYHRLLASAGSGRRPQ
jgi:serine/threonine-protein kinase